MKSLPICRRHPEATIKIGSNVKILNKVTENTAGIAHRCILAAKKAGARLIIGDNVGMSGVTLCCAKEIVIEDYVNLGVGVKVYDTDFHPVDTEARCSFNKEEVASGPVRICSRAWICADAIILKGVTIGPGAVVGAGAVVTKDVPPGTVVAGVPARVVGTVENAKKYCNGLTLGEDAGKKNGGE